MTLVDWLIIAYLILGMAVGLAKGLISQVVALVGIGIAVAVSFLLFPKVSDWLAQSLLVPISYAQPISLAVIFIACLVGLRFVMPIVEKVFGSAAKAVPFNTVAGALVGLATHVLIASIIVGVLSTLPTPESVKAAVNSSRVAAPLKKIALALDSTLGKLSHQAGVSLGFQIDSGDDTTTTLNFTVADPKEDFESEVKMALLVNELRDRRRVARLSPDPKLQEVAQAHGRDMLARGYFSHKSPEGVLVGGRIHQAGIAVLEVGENLARAASVELAMGGLSASPNHFKTMTSPDYNRLAVAAFDAGVHGKIFVQLFAKVP